MGKSENLSKGIIKRIIFILIVLLLLFGVGVLATTSAVNTVTISFADKTELTVVTTKSKIEEILKENNIYIAPDESVKQGLNSNIDATKTINIVRKSEIENEEENKETQVIKTEELLNSEGSVIVEKIIKETVEIPYETIKKEVTSKEKGEKVNKVVQKGKNGKKEITYKVKYQDDVEIERHKLSEKVIQKPVNKIIEVLKFSDIDFVIYDNEVSEYKNKINNYNDIKFKAKENYDSTVKIEDLLKTIRYKIDYSYDNYTLIKEIY